MRRGLRSRAGWVGAFAAATAIAGVGCTGDLPPAPVISGDAIVGHTLTVTPGAWTGGPASYVFQWHRCPTTTLTGCTTVGPNTSNYVLVAADAGSYIIVTDQGVGPVGSTPVSERSGPVGPVAPA